MGEGVIEFIFLQDISCECIQIIQSEYKYLQVIMLYFMLMIVCRQNPQYVCMSYISYTVRSIMCTSCNGGIYLPYAGHCRTGSLSSHRRASLYIVPENLF